MVGECVVCCFVLELGLLGLVGFLVVSSLLGFYECFDKLLKKYEVLGFLGYFFVVVDGMKEEGW